MTDAERKALSALLAVVDELSLGGNAALREAIANLEHECAEFKKPIGPVFDQIDYGLKTRPATPSSRRFEAAAQRLTAAMLMEREALALLGAEAILVSTGPHCTCHQCGATPFQLGVFSGKHPHREGEMSGERVCLSCMLKRGSELPR